MLSPVPFPFKLSVIYGRLIFVHSTNSRLVLRLVWYWNALTSSSVLHALAERRLLLPVPFLKAWSNTHIHIHARTPKHKLDQTRSQEIRTDRSDCETNDAWVPHGHAKPATHVTEPPEHDGTLGGRAAVGSQGPLYAQVPGSIPRASFCNSGVVLQICRGLMGMCW